MIFIQLGAFMQFTLKIAGSLAGAQPEIYQSKIFSNVRKVLNPNELTTVEVTQMIFDAIDKKYGTMPEEDRRIISAFLQDDLSNTLGCVLNNSKHFYIAFEQQKPVFNVYRPDLLQPTCSGLTIISELQGKIILGNHQSPPKANEHPVAHALFGANQIKAVQIANTAQGLFSTYQTIRKL